mmetsp:Transcript_9883/g.14200  ORF Transcript_9883/g.14200 Transcript_9883/m.14200 type:complete len:265 (+) Transcript_9883:47-841(+)
MPLKFKDIGSGPGDLLGDDFTNKISLKVKKSAGPVAVTIETERESGGDLKSKIGSKFDYFGMSFDKVQLKADGGYVFETSLKPYPGVKVAFKGNKGADLCVDYAAGNLACTSVIDVKEMSKVSASACFGLPSGMAMGGNLTYGLSGKTGVTGMNVGGSYSSGPLYASLTFSKSSQFNLGLLYKLDGGVTLATQTSHSSSKAFDMVGVGLSAKTDFGNVKAKYDSAGVVSACLIKEIAPKVTLTASGSLVASDMSNFKYGLGIVM